MDAYELKNMAMDFQAKTFNQIQLSVYERIADMEGSHLMEYIQRKNDMDDDFVFEWFEHNLSLRENERIINEFVDYSDDESITSENVLDEYKEEFIDYLRSNYEYDIESYMEDMDRDNYPMWNTLFEFKEEPTEMMIEAAKEAGFGVIDGFDEFNTTLFVSGAGYSFYGAHWIPLFLNMPWNEKLKQEVESNNLSYSMM